MEIYKEKFFEYQTNALHLRSHIKYFYSHGWYRGGISRTNAQKKLQGQPDGSFLLRNSQTTGTHFTLSFRSAGITLHYRIQYENGYWLVNQHNEKSQYG